MFQAIGFVIKYIPLIVGAVTFVQNFADPATPGPVRKAQATQFVVDALATLGIKANERTTHVIGFLVDMAVNVLNKYGIFEHAAGPDVEVVAVAAPIAVETRVPPKEDDPNAAEFARLAAEFEARQ